MNGSAWGVLLPSDVSPAGEGAPIEKNEGIRTTRRVIPSRSHTCGLLRGVYELRPAAASEAARASAILPPVMGVGSFTYQKVILVDPNAFTLDEPVASIIGGHPAGQGPFLDLAFDWTGSAGCSIPLEDVTGNVSYSGLLVTDVESQVLIGQTGYVNEFFTEYLVDPLPEG